MTIKITRLGAKLPNVPNKLIKATGTAAACQRLKSKAPNFIDDKLRHDSSSPYQLLETSLFKYLPARVLQTLPKKGLFPPTWQLPAGYHLVFFPPPTANLLPDGTDDMHFPGKPWVRRMWAGGSIHFKTDDGGRALTCKYKEPELFGCRENISNVEVKGNGKAEKVWVELNRAIGSQGGETAITEIRNLVFMRAKTTGEAIVDASKPVRTIKSKMKPDFSVSMVPDANLLFRFSALTFNAHRIHLDREYARTVEGFRNLVVHGPLSILLILKVLSSQMGNGQMVKSISYRNLSPLFADEKMTICLRRSRAVSLEANDIETPVDADSTPAQADITPSVLDRILAQADTTSEEQADSTQSELDSTPAQAGSTPGVAGNTPTQADSGITRWDVWIEDAEGGIAVKGSAETVAKVSTIHDIKGRLVRYG